MFTKKNPVLVFFVLHLCLLVQLSPAAAQTRRNAFAFNTLGITDGLSQGMVTRILQDRYGFMWFATLDGLNRYDGYKFTVYRHDSKDKTSITESYAHMLFEDSKGRLWIGTVSGGLDLYDAETETFIHVNQQQGGVNSLSEGPVNEIAEDLHGNIWVHIHNNLDKITIHENEKTGDREFSIHHVKIPFTTGKSLLSITKNGNIYFADSRAGILYHLDDEKKEDWSISFRLNDNQQGIEKHDPAFYRILQLVEDKANGKFYVFHLGGVSRFNEKTGALEKVFRNAFFTHCDTPLRAVLDKTGNIWFSSPLNLSLFDTRTGNVTNATAQDAKHEALIKSAYSTFIDRSGLLWIGTAGYGLLKRNIRSESFHHTGIDANYLIKEADNGKILIGHRRLIKEIFDKKTSSLNYATNTEAKQLDQYLSRPFAAANGVDWFADSNTLRYQDKISKQTIDYKLPVQTNNEYTEIIQSQCKDLNGNLWLGTTQGLLRFNVMDKKWTVFRNNPLDSSSLSSNVVFSLCLDPLQPKNYLWIGTSGGGLNRMDMRTGKSSSFTTKDGLPNNVIYGILNDDAGNLWMSTNKGLSCFDPSKKFFRNFDYKDGLQSNEFNRGAYCRTKDGYLFFGGVNGFNYFYPPEVLNNTAVPQIVITSLKIRNQVVPVQAKGSPLSKSVNHTDKLTLAYDQNFLAFEFASMDFTYPEKNSYQFKLMGLHKDWINAGTTNNATFTNLDPGTYTFMVQASNNDGTWNRKGTSIKLVILPPWYMTWWFRTGMVLLAFFAVYSFYRYRLGQALKLQDIRNGIADDLHDEVGSNLSNIYIFSNVAQQKEKANEATEPLLQKITDYTKQSMEAINDIVWMINTRNDRFENIMVKMRTLAAEFSETFDCILFIDLDEDLNHIKLDIEKRKNFYLIYKEAINNLAKYSGCKNVWIDMKLHQNNVTLMIRDNGKGFDMAKTNTGNGMFNMKKRAEMLKGALTVTSKIGEGTALQLNFKV